MQQVAGPVVVAIALLGACNTHATDPDEFPVQPGGNGGGGGGGSAAVDASIDPGDDGATATLDGRVCILADLRDRTSCANTGAGGIVVTVGGEQATTEDTGFFRITRPTGDGLVWRARGDTIVPSVTAYGPSFVIPAVATATYEDLLAAHGQLALVDGQGSIVARIVRNGQPLAGATATLGASQDGVTFYDGVTATAWDQDTTDAFGAAWLPAETVGARTLTVAPPLGPAVTAPVIVEDRAITFTTVDVP